MVWTYHEERPGVRRKKEGGNRVTRKEGKGEAEEKISRCSEEGYGESWYEEEGHWRHNAVRSIIRYGNP